MRRVGVALLAGVTAFGAASTLAEGVASASSTPTVVATVATGATVPSFLGTGTVTTLSSTLTVSGAITAGDTIVLTVGCPTSGTLSVTGLSGSPASITGSNATWTPTFVSNGACGSAVKNEVVLTASAPSGATSGTVVVPGIVMTATSVPTGNVVVSGTYTSTTPSTTFSVPTLATINNVTVTPATPLSVIASGTGDATIGNLSVTLPGVNTVQAAGYLYNGGGVTTPATTFYAMCVTVVNPTGSTGAITFDTINGAPTITQSNGASNATLAVNGSAQATGVPILVGGNTVQAPTIAFGLGNVSTTNAPTYLLSGLHVDVPSTIANGAATITVGFTSSTTTALAEAACTAPTALVTGLTGFLVGSAPSGAIYGQNASDTTAAEYDAAFVSTNSAGTATCTNNGNAVVSTSADPYDALSASYLEGLLGGGVLLTSPTSLDASTIAALKYAGVQRVYVVGGLLAVDQAVISQIQALPAYTCGGLATTGANIVVYSGISGQTADDTAVAIDNYISTNLAGNLPSITAAYSAAATYNQTTGNATATAPVGTQTTAIVVADTDYQDATTAAGLAYKYHLPVILTTGSALSATASAELTKLGITQVLALGGQLALTPAVVTSIQALSVNSVPVSVIRIAGQDGTQTAADLALFEGQQLGWTASTVLVAQGSYWSDALGAAALSANGMKPLLLTEGPTKGVGTYTDAVLKTAGSIPNGLGSGTTAGIQVLGGPLAVTAAQITEMQQSLAAG